MRTKLLTATMIAILTAGTGAAHAQPAPEAEGATHWVHVRVDEADGAKVALNLPISLVEVAVESRLGKEWGPDKLRLDRRGGISLEELRAMWRELRNAGDVDLVEVRDGDEHVRIYRRGETVHVRVDEGDVQKVRVDLPASIVDALLGSDGEGLDLAAAARELARAGSQEVVRIDDEGTTVRIWVDRTSQGG